MKPKLVVFDLNKTLIEENSWLDLNLAMGVTKEEDDALMELGMAGKITDAEGQARLCEIYKERGNPTKSRILEAIGKYTYRPHAEEIVAMLVANEIHVALLSGSMDIFVEKVADELGILMRAANNHFLFTDRILTEITTDENDDLFKLRKIKQWCGELGISLAEVCVIGDGENDLLLFRNCGTSITFEDSPFHDQVDYAISGLQEILGLIT